MYRVRNSDVLVNSESVLDSSTDDLLNLTYKFGEKFIKKLKWYAAAIFGS